VKYCSRLVYAGFHASHNDYIAGIRKLNHGNAKQESEHARMRMQPVSGKVPSLRLIPVQPPPQVSRSSHQLPRHMLGIVS
jgi:hypothetical protein